MTIGLLFLVKVLKDISYSIPYVRTVCNYVFLYIMQRYPYRFTHFATIDYIHMIQFLITPYSIACISIYNDTSIVSQSLQRYKKEVHLMGRPLYL